MKVNKILFSILTIFSILNLLTPLSYAENLKSETDPTAKNSAAKMRAMKLDNNGLLEKDEYEFVSKNESIARALCPYNCVDRGLSSKDCRAWSSIQDPTKCYVQDLRLQSEAINFR